MISWHTLIYIIEIHRLCIIDSFYGECSMSMMILLYAVPLSNLNIKRDSEVR